MSGLLTRVTSAPHVGRQRRRPDSQQHSAATTSRSPRRKTDRWFHLSGATNRVGAATATYGRTHVQMTADTQTRPTAQDDSESAPTTHQGIRDFVAEVSAMTTPDRVHWCTGSDEEWAEVTDALVASGTFTRLDPAKKPNSFWARTDPTDVARVEDRTFICSREEKDAGPTNNWMDPAEMKAVMTDLYRGCMRGRTMYVVPFVMGHLDAEQPMFGVEITDSAYVVASMRVMARMGEKVLRRMEELDARFVPALHSVGMPLAAGQEDVPW